MHLAALCIAIMCNVYNFITETVLFLSVKHLYSNYKVVAPVHGITNCSQVFICSDHESKVHKWIQANNYAKSK